MNNRQLSMGLQVEFQARFQARQARREAIRAQKEDSALAKQIQDLLVAGRQQEAFQKAKLLLTKKALGRQMDQMADMAELSVSQIQAENATNRMTVMMAQSSRVMSAAMANANPERTLETLDRLKDQQAEYGMNTAICQDAMSQSTSAQVPDNEVHDLLGKLADDAGVQLSDELNRARAATADPQAAAAAAAAASPEKNDAEAPPQITEPTPEAEDALQERLKALRA